MAKIIRRLDNNHDWCFGRGRADYLRNIDEVAQDIQTKLLEWKWNYFKDYERGIDWRFFLGHKNTKSLLDEAIKDTVKNIEEVTDITDYKTELNTSDRTYKISLQVTTIYGDLTVDANV